MRKLMMVLGIFVLAGTSVIALWTFWPVFFPVAPNVLPSQISRIDGDINSGRLDRAKVDLLRFVGNLTAGNWLSLLKRSTSISQRTGDWSFTLTLATRSVNQFPGNHNLAAFRVWAALKSGQVNSAETWARTLIGTAWEDYWLQAKVESLEKPSSVGNSEVWSWLRQTLATPAVAPLELYSLLLTDRDDSILAKDALLAALTQGRIDQASNFLKKLSPADLRRVPFDRLKALVAFDRGQWIQASDILKSMTQNPDRMSLLLLGEALLKTEDLDAAKKIYDKILADQLPPLPVGIYWVRAALALRDNDVVLAASILSKAQKQGAFSGEAGNLGRLLSWQTRFLSGDGVNVSKEMDQFSSSGEEDQASPFVAQVEMLRMKLWPDRFSLPRLWSLFHQFPTFPPLVENLSWNLMEAGSWQKAEDVLNEFEQRDPNTSLWWVWYYRGILEAHRQNYSLSLDDFMKVEPFRQDSYYHYNLGLISLLASQNDVSDKRIEWLQRSVGEFSSSLNELPGSPDAQFQSQILYSRAEASLALVPLLAPSVATETRSSARQDLQTAVTLDPKNINAAFLWRKSTATKDSLND